MSPFSPSTAHREEQNTPFAGKFEKSISQTNGLTTEAHPPTHTKYHYTDTARHAYASANLKDTPGSVQGKHPQKKLKTRQDETRQASLNLEANFCEGGVNLVSSVQEGSRMSLRAFLLRFPPGSQAKKPSTTSCFFRSLRRSIPTPPLNKSLLLPPPLDSGT